VRKLVLALAICGALLGASTGGCKHPTSKLEGHWKGTRADGVAAGAQDAANAFATQTEIVARGNAISISTPGSKGQQGTFVVDSESPSVVLVHTEKDGPANKETFSFTEDGKTMTWRLGDGRTITFQKQKD
jgi:hypothetical protein